MTLVSWLKWLITSDEEFPDPQSEVPVLTRPSVGSRRDDPALTDGVPATGRRDHAANIRRTPAYRFTSSLLKCFYI